LKVAQSWDPQPTGTFSVGDAFKRKITFRAPDLPGMVFPAIAFPEVEGLQLYQDRASVNDKMDRGSLTGERVDVITYLCEKPGSYSLPAIAIPWWNLDSQQMEKIILPAVIFEVQPGAAISPATEEVQQNQVTLLRNTRIAVGLVALLLIAALSVFHQPIGRYWIAWQARRKESEATYFKKILQADTASDTFNAINGWFIRSDFSRHDSSLSAFAKRTGYAELEKNLSDLYQAVSTNDPNWHPAPLRASLKSARADHFSKTKAQCQSGLKALNPN